MARRAHDRAASPPEAVPPAAEAAADAAQIDDREALSETLAPDESGVASPCDPTAAVASLQQQLDEARNRSLRAQAELENFRKRTQRNLEEERRFAAHALLHDLLPVVDNLQRAIAAAEEHDASAGLLAGVQLVATQLLAVLERHHCTLIPAAPGVAFDPHLHEAIAQLPATDCPPGHVCQVVQAGYQLHDRVIRPARVVVAARAPGADAAGAERAAATDAACPPSAPPDP